MWTAWTLAAVIATLASLLPMIWLPNAPPGVASYGGESDVIGSLILAVLQYACLIRLVRIAFRRAALWLGAALAQLVIGLSLIGLELAFPHIFDDLYLRVGSPPVWLFFLAVAVDSAVVFALIGGIALMLIFDDVLGLVLWLIIGLVIPAALELFVLNPVSSLNSLGPNPNLTIAILNAASGVLYGISTGLVIVLLTKRRARRASPAAI